MKFVKSWKEFNDINEYIKFLTFNLFTWTHFTKAMT